MSRIEREKKTVAAALGSFYQGGKRLIASYAPLIFEAYNKGDKVARDVLYRNINAIAKIIFGAAKHLPSGEDIKVALCGGITKNKDVILPILEECLKQDKKNRYIVTVCDKPISYGALILAGMEYKENI